MFPIFGESIYLQGSEWPIELCILALENSRDDPNIAVNWLLENGYREMDRMANAVIRNSGTF